MANDLKPSTLARKRVETESLDDFLARMVVVWHERQNRLAIEMQRRRDRVRASNARAKAADPEGYARRRLEAVRRYEERHPGRVKEKARLASLRRAEARSEARKAKLASPAEGYPKPSPIPSETTPRPSRAKPSPRVDGLTWALFGHVMPSAARPADLDASRSPAMPASAAQSALGRRAGGAATTP